MQCMWRVVPSRLHQSPTRSLSIGGCKSRCTLGLSTMRYKHALMGRFYVSHEVAEHQITSQVIASTSFESDHDLGFSIGQYILHTTIPDGPLYPAQILRREGFNAVVEWYYGNHYGGSGRRGSRKEQPKSNLTKIPIHRCAAAARDREWTHGRKAVSI